MREKLLLTSALALALLVPVACGDDDDDDGKGTAGNAGADAGLDGSTGGTAGNGGSSGTAGSSGAAGGSAGSGGGNVDGGPDGDTDAGADAAPDGDDPDAGPDDALPIASEVGSCTVRWTRTGPTAGDRIGSSVTAIGDVNGDGAGDLATVASEPARVEIVSGSNGSVIAQSTFDAVSYLRSAAGDADADGVEDIVLHSQECEVGDSGIPSSKDCRLVARVLSAKDASTLHTFLGPKGELSFMNGLIVVEDADNDGKADLLLARPPPPSVTLGTLTVHSSVTQNELGSVPAPVTSANMIGNGLVLLPDQDGDGRSELLVGDPSANNFLGTVFAIGTQSAAILWQGSGGVTDSDADLFGNPLLVSSDLGGDGFVDVLAGAHNHREGSEYEVGLVKVFDGKTGTPLWSVVGTREWEHFGAAIATAPDLNGDGRAEVLVGADAWSFTALMPGFGGRAAVLDGKTGQIVVDVRHEVAPMKLERFRFGGGLAYVGSPASGQIDWVVSAGTANIGSTNNAGQLLGLRCTLAAPTATTPNSSDGR